jgi:hypothetical protein
LSMQRQPAFADLAQWAALDRGPPKVGLDAARRAAAAFAPGSILGEMR